MRTPQHGNRVVGLVAPLALRSAVAGQVETWGLTLAAKKLGRTPMTVLRCCSSQRITVESILILANAVGVEVKIPLPARTEG